MAKTKKQKEVATKNNNANQDKMAKLMVENERELLEKMHRHQSGMSALIVLAIAMGQAAQTLIGDACDIHNVASSTLSNRIRREMKAAFSASLKHMQTAKALLETANDMQDVFVSSARITTSQQLQIGEEFLRKYNEIAELCCLYEDAVESGSDIMQLLRPIFMGQIKRDHMCIQQKTIERFRMK